jgi:hypothetical protein
MTNGFGNDSAWLWRGAGQLVSRMAFSTSSMLLLAFEGIGDAGRFAVDLSDCIRSTDWKSKGLPENLGLRTTLHAGPVYLCTDPVTQLPICIGTHVSYTARIEPITLANEVYASEAFAALAVAQGITEFACH